MFRLRSTNVGFCWVEMRLIASVRNSFGILRNCRDKELPCLCFFIFMMETLQRETRQCLVSTILTYPERSRRVVLAALNDEQAEINDEII